VIIFLHSINRLEFVMKTHGVFREVETEIQCYIFRQITDWDFLITSGNISGSSQ